MPSTHKGWITYQLTGVIHALETYGEMVARRRQRKVASAAPTPPTDAATADLEPGADRLDTIARTYLDTCLEHRGVRALLLEARADPQIAEEIAARNTASAAQVVDDLKALGWPDPRQTARLWVGLVAEAALLEHASSRRDHKLRRALAQLTRR